MYSIWICTILLSEYINSNFLLHHTLMTGPVYDTATRGSINIKCIHSQLFVYCLTCLKDYTGRLMNHKYVSNQSHTSPVFINVFTAVQGVINLALCVTDLIHIFVVC